MQKDICQVCVENGLYGAESRKETHVFNQSSRTGPSEGIPGVNKDCHPMQIDQKSSFPWIGGRNLIPGIWRLPTSEVVHVESVFEV